MASTDRWPIRPALALAGLLVAAVPAAAQAPADVAGTWSVTWDAGVRTDGDRVTEVLRRLTSPLVLDARGDSLTGTWQGIPSGPVVPVAGRVKDGVLELATAPREVTDGGRTFVLRIRFEGRLEGDALRGVMYVDLGNGRGPPRRWEGRRR